MWSAYWAGLPWLDCIRNFLPFGVSNVVDLGLGGCAVGRTPSGPVSMNASYLNLVAAAVYVVAALWVVRRARVA